VGEGEGPDGQAQQAERDPHRHDRGRRQAPDRGDDGLEEATHVGDQREADEVLPEGEAGGPGAHVLHLRLLGEEAELSQLAGHGGDPGDDGVGIQPPGPADDLRTGAAAVEATGDRVGGRGQRDVPTAGGVVQHRPAVEAGHVLHVGSQLGGRQEEPAHDALGEGGLGSGQVHGHVGSSGDDPGGAGTGEE